MLPSHINHKLLMKIAEIIGDNDIRIVGGAVREHLMGRASSDLDLVTKVEPTVVAAKLSDAGIKTLDTGLPYGTVIACLPGGDQLEITTLRRDINQDGRKTNVIYTESFAEDSARRDFTINALYMDLNGKIHDFQGGLSDIKSRTLRFIGDPDQRIQEDYLRILRFFRFLGYYEDMHYEPAIIDAIKRNLEGLTKLSRERIKKELFLTLATPYSLKSMTLAHDLGVIATILRPLKTLKMTRRSGYWSVDLLLNLGLDQDLHPLNELLKLSRSEQQEIKTIASSHLNCPDDHYHNLYYHENYYPQICALHNQLLLDLKRHALPLNSYDIQQYFNVHGPSLGKLIVAAEEAWIKSHFCASKNDLLAIIGRRL